MSTLIERAIDRLALETGFRMELMLMRLDWRDRTASKHTIDQRIRRLANNYDLPTWRVRGWVEEGTTRR